MPERGGRPRGPAVRPPGARPVAGGDPGQHETVLAVPVAWKVELPTRVNQVGSCMPKSRPASRSIVARYSANSSGTSRGVVIVACSIPISRCRVSSSRTP